MKSHIIAKLIFGLVLFMIYSYLFISIKYIHSKISLTDKIEYLNNIDKSTFDGKFKKLSYNLSEYLTTKSDNTILVYSFLLSCILIFIMDITLGVGRSRTEERKNKSLSST